MSIELIFLVIAIVGIVAGSLLMSYGQSLEVQTIGFFVLFMGIAFLMAALISDTYPYWDKLPEGA